MAYRIMTKIPQLVMESEGVQVYQTSCNYIQKSSLSLFLQVLKEEVQTIPALCHPFIQGLANVNYRDVIEVISSNPSFVALLSLSEMPHFTMIQKFCKRISMKLFESVFNKVVKFFEVLLGNIILIDSRGFPVNHRSFCCDKRLNDFCRKERKKYIKTTIIVDDKSHTVVSYSVHLGEIHDSKEFEKIYRRVWAEK